MKSELTGKENAISKNKKILIFSILGVVIIALLGYIAYRMYYVPYTFDINDRCGPIPGGIMHTITDSSICSVRCVSQCEAQEMKYDKAEFLQQATSCNKCSCTCLNKRW